MTRPATVYLMLFAFAALQLSIAAWARRRVHNGADFVIANRRLGSWLVALSYTGNVLNAWTLMLVCAAAFVWGLSAVWIWVAALVGCVINMWFVAPRLRALSSGQGHATLIQVLSVDAGERLQPLVARSAVFIVTVTLLLQVGAMLRAAAGVLETEFAFDPDMVLVLSLALIVICVFAGGLLAACVCDAAQMILMLIVAVSLSLSASMVSGGWGALWSGLSEAGPGVLDWFGGKQGVVAAAFVAGALGIGLAATGQPQALNRCMAASESSLGKARWIALAWTAVLLAAVLLSGWYARVLYAELQQPQQAMFAIALQLLPSWLAAILVFALLSAILLGVASLLLVVAAGFAVDLRRCSAPLSLPANRLALVVAAATAGVLAMYAPGSILEHSLFAFTALGASFGPLLLVRLSGKRIRPGSTLGAIWAGFVLSLLFHLLPDAPGDFLERVMPFIASLGIALTGGERRRNPDRADRSQETVHDRVPI